MKNGWKPEKEQGAITLTLIAKHLYKIQYMYKKYIVCC